MISKKNLKILNSFYETVLVNEDWFSKMIDESAVDLILLTGSLVTGNNDINSDIDLFLITTQKNQKKFKLKPVYEFIYKGENIEISMFTRESLENSAERKDKIFRWKNIVLFKSFNKKLLKQLKKHQVLIKMRKEVYCGVILLK